MQHQCAHEFIPPKAKKKVPLEYNNCLERKNVTQPAKHHLTPCPQSRTSPSPPEAKLHKATGREGELRFKFFLYC